MSAKVVVDRERRRSSPFRCTDTLDQYLHYFDREAASVVAPKFIVSLVELITFSINTVTSPSPSVSYFHPSQRIEVASPDMIQRHFRNTVKYIHSKKTPENPGRYDEAEVVGAFLKTGITR